MITIIIYDDDDDDIVTCEHADHQSYWHCDGEEAGEAATPHHAYHGLRPHLVPEETGPCRSGSGEIMSETVLGRSTQG